MMPKPLSPGTRRSLTLLIAISAATVLLGAVVRIRPESALLVYPGVHSRSPFCSRWQAMTDCSIKLHQHDIQQQIATGSRLLRQDGTLALWSTPRGDFWIPAGDRDTLPILLAQEDRDIYGGKQNGVRHGDVVFDCGAYVGTWARQALERGAKLVVEIEPSPDSVTCIRRNLAKEIETGRVIVIPKGIWDRDTTLTFFENPDNTAGNSFVEGDAAGAKGTQIPVTTIDRLAAELKLERVGFIKADVKGATLRLLDGGTGVLTRDRPRLAFSTEEVSDDVRAIASRVAQILPAYQMRCGPCLLDGKDIYTDVLFFQ